ncbi:MAG: YfiR family protein [Sporichthyaceae bacterium]|nr:YfiR family protein [Sporichthyaceae bacterium]
MGLLAVGARLLAGQEVAVPVQVQVPLLLKILPFDRNLQVRSGGRVVVGILYQGRYRISAGIADEVHRAIAELPATATGGLSPRSVLIDLDITPDLGPALRRLEVNVLYVSPLRAVDLATVAAVTRTGQITSLTGVPRYVEIGLAVGLDMKGERPQIVVNLGASRAEGADFSAQLLKLARVVDRAGDQP